MNPFAQDMKPVVMRVTVDAETAAVLELMLEDLASSTARSVEAGTFMAVFDDAERAEVEARLARYVAHAGVVLAPQYTPLEETNWAEQAARDFPPMRIGRFYVAGSHYEGEAPANSIPLVIDASAAFGTGEHATTEGCLRALEKLHKHRRFTRILDMGCGTAILAAGAYALWKRKLLAVDNDAVAVKVARVQMRQNRMQHVVRCEVGDGYKQGLVKRAGKRDLIVANILARPLTKMAKHAKAQMVPGGVLVLSGLLNTQEAMVLSAHRYQGMYLRRRMRIGKWSILVVGSGRMP